MYTPVKREPNTTINEMASPRTPPLSSFSRELRQVLQERNMFTVKTRTKVCSMLMDSGNNTPMGTPNSNPEANKRKNFRLQAIEEIISSEKTYLNQLEILMKYFVLPLKEQGLIDDVSHTALFGQIEMIHNLNGEFLRELEVNVENVAHAFLKMAPFFKLYSVYAFDYRGALFTLQDLTSKNTNFRKFLEQTETRPEVQRKLNSLMIVPIQRVPRYKLLLEQVLLYTSPADVDFKLLKESVKQIESTVLHINSCVEDQEVTQHLINLQNSLVNRMPSIVKPSRKVIKEGLLNKVTRTGSEVKRYCILMSDIFMYCKIHKDRTANTVVDNSLECCCIFPLKKCKVYDLLPGNFKLTCQGDGVIFATTELQLCRTWVAFIQDAIDLHIQCRQTLRKESSKRKPMRKKDLKNFGTDYVLSPNKRKCDYETIFRNINESEDERDVSTSAVGNCFSCNQMSKPIKTLSEQKPKKRLLKRKAPKIPECEYYGHIPNSSRLSNFFKQSRGVLKRNTKKKSCHSTAGALLPITNNQNDPNHAYAFANRYSDTTSYFRAYNVDNTIPTATAVNMQDLLKQGLESGGSAENFRDILYPLRLSGGKGNNNIGTNIENQISSNSHTTEIKDFNFAKTLNDSTSNWVFPNKEYHSIATPPKKKRVKFQDAAISEKCFELQQQQPYPFHINQEIQCTAGTSLGQRVTKFFSKLWFK